MVIISLYIHTSKQYVVHQKLIQLYLNEKIEAFESEGCRLETQFTYLLQFPVCKKRDTNGAYVLGLWILNMRVHTKYTPEFVASNKYSILCKHTHRTLKKSYKH